MAARSCAATDLADMSEVSLDEGRPGPASFVLANGGKVPPGARNAPYAALRLRSFYLDERCSVAAGRCAHGRRPFGGRSRRRGRICQRGRVAGGAMAWMARRRESTGWHRARRLRSGPRVGCGGRDPRNRVRAARDAPCACRPPAGRHAAAAEPTSVAQGRGHAAMAARWVRGGERRRRRIATGREARPVPPARVAGEGARRLDEPFARSRGAPRVGVVRQVWA
jgi:hypothetical protein